MDKMLIWVIVVVLTLLGYSGIIYFIFRCYSDKKERRRILIETIKKRGCIRINLKK